MKQFWDSSERFRLLIICLLSVIGVFSTAAYIPSFPYIEKDLNTSASMLQLSLSVFLLGASVGQLIFGLLSDAKGRLSVLRFAMIGYVIASFFAIFSPNGEWLVICRLIQGLMAGSGVLLSRAISRDLYKGQRLTEVIAISIAAISIMPAIGPAIGGVFDTLFGWRSIFGLFTVLGIFMLWASFQLIKETNPSIGRPLQFYSIYDEYKSLLKNSVFMAYAFINFCFFWGLFSFSSASGYLFIAYFQWPSYAYIIVGLCISFGSLLGSIMAKKLAYKLTRQRAILIATWFSTISLLIMGVWSQIDLSPQSLLIPVIGIFAAVNLAASNATSAALEINPKVAGAASAIIGFLQMLSGAIASLAIAPFVQQPFFIILVMAAPLAIIFLLYRVVIKYHQRSY